MADDKKPPDFDPEKTVVDVRRPGAPHPTEDAGDKTAAKSHPAPPPAAEEAKTVLLTRPRTSAPPADDADKTVVTPAARRAPAEAERTVVRSAVPETAAGPAPFEIVCLSGQARGRRFPVRGREALIGSNPGCQVQLPGIEGVHAKLEQRDDGYELQNVGSARSVVLGGRTVTRAKLKSGDLAKIGEVVIRFVKAGDVFSSDFSEADLAPKGFSQFLDPAFLKENPRYLLMGGLALALLFGVLFWPAPPPDTGTQQQPQQSASDVERQKEIESLLASGEVLFNADKLMAPPDQPDRENAFAKFNDVLALDPGNEKALAWLKRIDDERDRQRKVREQQEQERLARERERQELARQELERKVNAIIAEGDALFDKGQVAEPAGRNALVFYREALKVDPESRVARARVQRAMSHYVEQGDDFRDKGDLWRSLENYRKASRINEGQDTEVEGRVRETEARLRSGMAGTGTRLIMYKDDRGQLFVLDEMDKVPARYKDRAVIVEPAGTSGQGGP